MALPQTVQAQRDFSAGEVDASLKRNEDDPHFKAGLRQCSNFRILDTKKLANRFGRRAIFLDGPRNDKVIMSSGNAFYLCFSAQTLTVRNASGIPIFTKGMLPWLTNQVGSIAWDIIGLNIYICFQNTQPQVLSWDGVTANGGWSIAPFAETTSLGNQKRTLFYRISPPGVTMLPSARTGAITLTFSSGILVNGHVGTRMRYANRQVLITSITSSTVANATVEENLLSGITVTTDATIDIRNVASVGDVVIGSQSGAQAVITVVTDASHFNAQYLTGQVFQAAVAGPPVINGDVLVAPGGALGQFSSGSLIAPQAVTIWDDEVMNAFRGWPAFVFADQGRLGFCNFPSVPAGIAWSAIGLPLDLYVGAQPANAIFELAPGKVQVLYVVAGAESSEFVFGDTGVFYIPITPSNPLTPSSVGFARLSGDGCAAVQPRLVQEAIVYLPAGASTVRAITATGAYLRPFETRHLSKLHDHLFNAPVAIAAPAASDPAFPERYIYILNGDGTVAVAKVDIEDGRLREEPGWVPWSGSPVQWISARQAEVLFTTNYTPGGISAVTVAEVLDASQYLDAAIFYNAAPTGLPPPGAMGPLWWLANGTVTVLDLGTRLMGLYNIDATGKLIPQNFGGENLASAQLVAGQAWTATVEPFIQAPGPGQDLKQRMVKRKVGRLAVYVKDSTGFLLARLFSGPLKPGGPALGTQMNVRRVPAYNEDDDPTQAPPLREGTEMWRPSGRSYDPRVAIIKDTPGSLTILEIGEEVTV